MKRLALFSTFAFVAATACGGSDAPANTDTAPAPAEPVEQPEPMGELTMPDWYQMSGNEVTMTITAGATNAQNYWNFNGFVGGQGEIVVPVGSNVTINFVNSDPNMAHSLGIEAERSSMMGALTPNAAFEGALSSNPGSLTDSTLPGESETLTFTVDRPGRYQMICYVPGHAQIGMWVTFIVSEDGSAGARM